MMDLTYLNAAARGIPTTLHEAILHGKQSAQETCRDEITEIQIHVIDFINQSFAKVFLECEESDQTLIRFRELWEQMKAL